MARQLLRDTCELAAEILDGKHDDNLTDIGQAVQARKKQMFRRGTAVQLVGTRRVDIDGLFGRVVKANARTITVRLDDGREFNCDTSLLRVVSDSEWDGPPYRESKAHRGPALTEEDS